MKNNDEKNAEDKKTNGDDIESHDFDGIKEKDTPIPWWFNVILYGSIIFAVVYFIYYHVVQDGQSLHNEELLSMGKTLNNSSSDEYNYTAASKDPKILAHAKKTFATNCASCHGLQGEGGVGPNLTAGYWTHGNTYKDLVRVISDGVSDKGMPAWGSILGKKNVNELVAYIASIQGTNPPNSKKPEGTPGALQ